MKIIGITGGIGAGKSTVLKLLREEYHAYIVETDVLAHDLMCVGKPVYAQIVDAFGKDILMEDMSINRNLLGGLVFSDENKLQKLNGIVHPAVKNYILSDIQTKKTEGRVSLYIIEAALLIEDGYKEICDELWYIRAEEEVRIQRLIEGRGGSRQKWLEVMKNQSDEAFYISNCEHIVNNNEDFVKTANIVKELLFSSR